MLVGKTSRGFTIVELLIVIVVIGILAAITIVAFTGIQTRARDAERSSEAAAIMKAVEMYRADNGSYPLQSGGNENSGYNTGGLATFLVPKYMGSLPADPRSSDGIEYQYARDVNADAFAIRIRYESKPECRLGTNDSAKTWWGIPKC